MQHIKQSSRLTPVQRFFGAESIDPQHTRSCCEPGRSIVRKKQKEYVTAAIFTDVRKADSCLRAGYTTAYHV